MLDSINVWMFDMFRKPKIFGMSSYQTYFLSGAYLWICLEMFIVARGKNIPCNVISHFFALRHCEKYGIKMVALGTQIASL